MRLERPWHGESTQLEDKTTRRVFRQVYTRVAFPDLGPNMVHRRQNDLTRMFVATPTDFTERCISRNGFSAFLVRWGCTNVSSGFTLAKIHALVTNASLKQYCCIVRPSARPRNTNEVTLGKEHSTSRRHRVKELRNSNCRVAKMYHPYRIMCH